MPFRKQNGQTHLLRTKNREGFHIMERLWTIWSSLVDKTVKNLPAMHKTWVQSLGQEDPLEKGMVTYASILAWEIPWTAEPGRLQSMGSQTQTQLSDKHITVQSLSHVQLFATPWTIAHQAPLSMGFPRQEYRSG